MGILDGKRAVIVGLASNRSIAWGIARALRSQGAELAFNYQTERLRGRVQRMAGGVDSDIVLPLDVSQDRQIDNFFDALAAHWDGFRHPGAFRCLRSGRPVDRPLPGRGRSGRIQHRARHFQLQLCRARQGRPANDAGETGGIADPELPGRNAGATQLQCDGSRQGQPGGQRPLHGNTIWVPMEFASTPYPRGRFARLPHRASRACGRCWPT